MCIIYYALYYNYYLFYCLLEVKVIHYEYINYVNSKKVHLFNSGIVPGFTTIQKCSFECDGM